MAAHQEVVLAQDVPADGSDACAAIRHQERGVSRRPSSVRARQHGSGICRRPPPEGVVSDSLSWTADLPPGIIQNGRTALQMRLPKLNERNALP